MKITAGDRFQTGCIDEIEPERLRVNEFFRLSYPLRPERLNYFRKVLNPLPLVFINQKDEIVFGFDSHYALKTSSRPPLRLKVLRLALDSREALLLNFNLSQSLVGLTLFEKLHFVQRMWQMGEKESLHQVAPDLGIPVNRTLISHLEILTDRGFEALLSGGSLDLKVALRLCDRAPTERKLMIRFFSLYSFSRTRQFQVLEMIEDLQYMTRKGLKNVFRKAGVSLQYPPSQTPAETWQRLRACRFPRLTAQQRAFTREVDRLKPPPGTRISPVKNFETREIDLHIRVRNLAELKRILSMIPGKKSN